MKKHTFYTILVCLTLATASCVHFGASASNKSKAKPVASKSVPFFSTSNYHLIMGHLFFKLEKYPNALISYKKAIESDPSARQVAMQKITEIQKKMLKSAIKF